VLRLLLDGLDVADAEQDEEHRHVGEVTHALLDSVSGSVRPLSLTGSGHSVETSSCGRGHGQHRIIRDCTRSNVQSVCGGPL
jgi:hypothetical protein